MTDDSWPMIEEAVFRHFDEFGPEHTAVGPRLADLGWSDIEAEYPVQAAEVLFRAQGSALALTDCLDRIMLAELAPVLSGPADAVLLPTVTATFQATGPVGTVLPARMTGTSYANPGITFTGTVQVPFLGNQSANSSCYAPVNPVLASTEIV